MGGGVDGWTDKQAQTNLPLLVGGMGGSGTFFFTKNPNLKKNWGGRAWGGGGRGRGGTRGGGLL